MFTDVENDAEICHLRNCLYVARRMSELNYAARLSRNDDKGSLGAPEKPDSAEVGAVSAVILARMIKESKHLVVLTGAGLSTSCGISDFRGPKGVWTLEEKGVSVSSFNNRIFELAAPSYSHLALVALYRAGILKYCISQNVDGLHLRSGLPRVVLAELHGNLFMEWCVRCNREYLRDRDCGGISKRYTGRRCECGGRLRDNVLDWNDALPDVELKRSGKECTDADVLLCLGTSLQIAPCMHLPNKTVKSGGKVVICNLQSTPKDKSASLIIRRPVDEIFRVVVQELGMRLPEFIRTVTMRTRTRVRELRIAKRIQHLTGYSMPPAEYEIQCQILSDIGEMPCPWIASVQLADRTDFKTDAVRVPITFSLSCNGDEGAPRELRLKLLLAKECSRSEIVWSLPLVQGSEWDERVHNEEIMRVDYNGQ